jgi:hypothetical protein
VETLGHKSINKTILYSSVFVSIAFTFSWAYPQPIAVENLVDEDNSSISNFNRSENTNSTKVMVMGSPHLNQDDKNYSSRSFERINRELVSYEPDMIVVEYLPPDYPVGKGQDYRPGFNLSRYAEKWNTSIEKGRKLINEGKKGSKDCELGKAYFLVRDFPNAAYHW